jgi:four helix bundle protein
MWQRGIELLVLVYDCTARFPVPPGILLKNRLREAAVAVSETIALGTGRPHPREREISLRSALRSLTDLRLHVEIARVSGFLCHADADFLVSDIETLQVMILRRSGIHTSF